MDYETDNPAAVRHTLREITQDEGERELVFDPRTSQLVVVQEGSAPNPNAISATSVASEGVF